MTNDFVSYGMEWPYTSNEIHSSPSLPSLWSGCKKRRARCARCYLWRFPAPCMQRGWRAWGSSHWVCLGHHLDLWNRWGVYDLHLPVQVTLPVIQKMTYLINLAFVDGQASLIEQCGSTLTSTSSCLSVLRRYPFYWSSSAQSFPKTMFLQIQEEIGWTKQLESHQGQ